MGRERTTVGDWGRIGSKRLGTKKYRAWVTYRAADGTAKTIYRIGESAGAAEKAVKDAVKEMATRVVATGGIAPETKLSELLELFFDEIAAGDKHRDSTVSDYRQLAKRHIIPALGKLTVAECSTGRLDNFIKAVAANHPATAKLCRAILSGAFGMAVRHDAIKVNPVTGTANVSVKKAATDDDDTAMIKDDLTRLRARVVAWMNEKTQGRPRTKDMLDVCDILTATGIRVGELCAIRWQDVDLKSEPATITVSGTVKRENGKLIRQPFPKSTSGFRIVSLPGFARDVLLRRRVDSISEYVFASSTGTLREPANLQRQWRDARGEEFKDVTPHSFRKVLATELEEKIGIRAAMKQLGHSREDTTDDYYVQRPDEAGDYTDVIGGLMPKTS